MKLFLGGYHKILLPNDLYYFCIGNRNMCVWFRTISFKRLAFHHRSFLLQSIVVSERLCSFVLIWDSKANNIMRSFWIYSRLSFPWYVKSGLMLDGRRKEKSHCVSSTRQMLTISILLQLRVVNSKLYIKMYHVVQRKRNHCQILSLKNKIWLSLAVTSIYNIESIPHQVHDCCNLVSNRRNDGFPKVRRMVGGKDINSRKSIPRCAP